MGALLTILSLVFGLGALVCFIMIVVKMFQNGATGMGIATILLVFCGIGGIVVLIFGWIKATEWNIKNLMLAYTGFLVGAVIVQALTFATGGGGLVPQ